MRVIADNKIIFRRLIDDAWQLNRFEKVFVVLKILPINLLGFVE